MKNEKIKIIFLYSRSFCEYGNSMHESRGQALLIFLVFFLFTSLALIFGLVTPSTGAFQSAQETVRSRQSYLLAESGVEDVVYRLRNNKSVSSSETLTLNTTSATTTLTDLGSGQKQVVSLGNVSGRQRTVKVKVVTGSGISFNYGIQAGQGGLDLDGSSGIVGNVYSMGPITGCSTCYITGSAISANSTALSADQTNGTSGTPPNTIVFGNASGTQDLAQSFKLTAENPINKVQFYIKKIGAPSDVTVRIATDNSGSPSTTYLASGTLSASLVTTSYGWINVVFTTNPTLEANTTYWLVLDASTSSTKYYTIGSNTIYTNGAAKIGQVGGTWNSTTPSGLDEYFQFYLGGLTGSISGESQWNQLPIGTVSGLAQAHTVNYVNVSGALNCQSGTGNNKACNNTLPDPTPQPLPISEANIVEWQSDAAAGGTYTGSCTIGGTTQVSIGSKKIVCNTFQITNSAVVTVTGPLWITGNIIIDGAGILKLASSYGASSEAVIADGKITIGGSSPVNGSGTTGSYILMLSNSDCPTTSTCGTSNAIDISGSAGAVVLYAANGTIKFSGSASAKEATGYRITLQGTTSVAYQSGLINPNFTSGPSGTYAIQSWQETQ